MFKLQSFVLGALLCQMASGFSFSQMESKRITNSVLSLQNNNDVDFLATDSRRDFLHKIQFAAVAGFGLGSGVLAPPVAPANAVGGLEKVNAKLVGYGLPKVTNVPGGFTPLLEIYGKGKNRFPILVQFNHPVTWVVTVPNVNVNGEDGTVQAGEYSKGDTATFFVYSAEGHVDNIAQQPKEFFQRALIKAISQKGDNIYQNFKITKVVPQTGPEYNGKDYVICDFKYELLTGAGFEVDRRGIAAITSDGPAVEVLWAASTRERYKKTEQTLRDITSSFRVYVDGFKLSEELTQKDLMI